MRKKLSQTNSTAVSVMLIHFSVEMDSIADHQVLVPNVLTGLYLRVRQRDEYTSVSIYGEGEEGKDPILFVKDQERKILVDVRTGRNISLQMSRNLSTTGSYHFWVSYNGRLYFGGRDPLLLPVTAQRPMHPQYRLHARRLRVRQGPPRSSHLRL